VKLLLDTHIFLWWLFDDPSLPERIRGLLRDIENDVFVSAASVWEIATKYRLGKLPHASEVARNVPLWIQQAGFLALAVSPEHAQLAGTWEIDHRDPFDRMIAAQASIEKLALASNDKAISLFPIMVIHT
jgi:PIN domain nuclease of toxin-antitoxin system